jgi:hypothetical protein
VGEGGRKHFSFAILDLSFVIEEIPTDQILPITNDKSKIANEKCFLPPLPLSHSPTLSRFLTVISTVAQP